MKSFTWLLLVVLMSGSAIAANHDRRMSGDTIGAAIGTLSNLKYSLARAQEITLVYVMGQPDTAGKQFCTAVGEAVGYAFAVQTAIRFNTDIADEDYVAPMISNLIDRTTEVRNDYCLSSTIGLSEAKLRLKDADQFAAKAVEILKSARLK